MSQKIKKAVSDDEIEAALVTAKNKMAAVDPDEVPFSADTATAITDNTPLFIAKRKGVKDADEAFKAINNPYIGLLDKLRSYTSHGFQLVNFKINDLYPGWTIAMRAWYGLPIKGDLPKMNSEDKIIQGSKNFIGGETTRVAAGGTALLEYTKVEVAGILTTVTAQGLLKTAAVDTLDEAQAALNAEREICLALIPLMNKEIEFASLKIAEAQRRSYCEEWGMKFVHQKGIGVVTIRTEDFATHAAVAAVDLRLGKPTGTGGPKTRTNARGEGILESQKFEPTYIIAEHILYERAVVEVTLLEDGTIDVIIKMKKLPIQEQS